MMNMLPVMDNVKHIGNMKNGCNIEIIINDKKNSELNSKMSIKICCTYISARDKSFEKRLIIRPDGLVS